MWLVDSYQWQEQEPDTDTGTSSASVTEDGTGIATVTVNTRDDITTAGTFTLRWTDGTTMTQDLAPLGWSTRSAADAMSESVGLADLAYVFGLRAEVTITFDLVVPITVENAASVAAWGPRPLPLPQWLRYTDAATATAALQPIVDALGEPRRIHSIELAVPQAETGDNAVLDVEPGDYRRITVTDRRLPTNIDAICMVLSAELRVSARQRGAFGLVCIESGGRAYSDGYAPGYG